MSLPLAHELELGERRDARSGWDVWLLVAVGLLACFGLLMVVTASGGMARETYGSPWRFGVRQAMGLGLGTLGAVLVLSVPWRGLRDHARWVWAGSVLSLLAVHLPIIGHAAKGAPRWISLGPVNLQPSELAKIALALVLADVLARNEGHLEDVVGVVLTPVVVFVLPVLGALVLQSDLGSIALMLGITAVAFFVAGLPWRWGLAFGGVVAAGIALLIAVEPYRAARVVSFLDPLADPQGDGYQVVQGWIALAEGGVTGLGLGAGIAQQGFLPEAHTDMIAAVIAEELGIGGWLAIFFLHGVVLWRGVRIATEAHTLYDMILASCLTAVLAAQVIINAGVIGGLVPPKGLVLPFVSYGASAAIAHLLMVGLLLRIGLETHRAREAAA